MSKVALITKTESNPVLADKVEQPQNLMSLIALFHMIIANQQKLARDELQGQRTWRNIRLQAGQDYSNMKIAEACIVGITTVASVILMTTSGVIQVANKQGLEQALSSSKSPFYLMASLLKKMMPAKTDPDALREGLVKTIESVSTGAQGAGTIASKVCEAKETAYQLRESDADRLATDYNEERRRSQQTADKTESNMTDLLRQINETLRRGISGG